MAITQVVSVAQSLRQPNTYSFAAAQPIPTGVLAVTLIPNISLADKLSVGETMECKIYVDGQFLAGGTWTSYGPGGITTGSGLVNPDPQFSTGDISKHVGSILSVDFTIPQAMTCGLTVTITT